MKIAVLSGKGGTGKTFVSVNLAYIQDHAAYVDCDVEVPNGHLFLPMDRASFEPVDVTAAAPASISVRFMRWDMPAAR